MNQSVITYLKPQIFGLFQKRIDGDDALLELARLRFKQSNLAVELYAENPQALEWLLNFKPYPHTPATVHLSRKINLFDPSAVSMIVDFAKAFQGRVYGFVIHDQREMALDVERYKLAAERLNARLETIQSCPKLFIEYACGLEPDGFVSFFQSIENLQGISCCIDIGHVGISRARKVFRQFHHNVDVWKFKPNHPELPNVINDVDYAVKSALPTALEIIDALKAIDKPLHFHLHDAHPISTFSRYNVCDHLSFFQTFPIPFLFNGTTELDPMYGPSGLSKIVFHAFNKPNFAPTTLTLEIHPIIEGRKSLDDGAYLFNHWTDKTNAEQMNRWLSVIVDNYRLLESELRDLGISN
jgi:hypothetical protein